MSKKKGPPRRPLRPFPPGTVLDIDYVRLFAHDPVTRHRFIRVGRTWMEVQRDAPSVATVGVLVLPSAPQWRRIERIVGGRMCRCKYRTVDGVMEVRDA